ncbi:MAG: hypothetical protein AB7D46_00890 [Flavobacteriaceae bacterium]
MARSLSDIKLQMTESFINNETIQEHYELTPGQTFEQEFSKVSLENIIFSITAFAIWTLETLWDIFKAENEAEMAKQKIHSKDWYRQKALDFQYGFPVINGTDQFDNTGKTDEEIETSKIVAQAACIKLISTSGYGILRVKAAKSDGNDLVKLSEPEVTALRYYFMRHSTDAGTQLKVTSGDADDLKLQILIQFDPLILGTDGARLDGTAQTPVIDAIKEFLKSLDFNGALVLDDLRRKIRTVEGVSTVEILGAFSKYGSYNYETTGIQNVGSIEAVRVADAGYMKLDEENLTIQYVVNNG